ncbi:MAG: class I SAM-dependent methyltransferase [Streptosporangiaceae bacterium]
MTHRVLGADAARHSAFVGDHTRIAAPPYVPEVRLHLAEEAFELWETTEEELGRTLPPPFWAFAWVGGQALARYVLDHPDLVHGRRVLDLASGCGLVAIAAAKAGAAHVTATEIDRLAVAAIALNAENNGVAVAAALEDVLDKDPADAGVVLAGDVFYEKPTTRRMLSFLERAYAGGASVLVGDPGRAHLPRPRLEALATYDVPAPLALEDAEVKRTTVWRLSGH